MNEKGGKINFPAVWQIPRQRSSPSLPPPPPERRTCLFLEVPTVVPAHWLAWKSERKRTQGDLREADLRLPRGCGRPGKPSSLPRGREATLTEQPALGGGDPRGESVTRREGKANPDSSRIAPSGSLEKAGSSTLKVLRGLQLLSLGPLRSLSFQAKCNALLSPEKRARARIYYSVVEKAGGF